MSFSKLSKILLIAATLAGLGIIAYWLPPIHRRLSWRLDFAMTYVRGVIQPVSAMPTSLPAPHVSTTRQAEATTTPLPPTATLPGPTATPLPSPTPIPSALSLQAPPWEKQDINNCGPASLSMYLNYYGWKGDQFQVDQVIKPIREDRNVNVEELAYFVRTHAGWLNVMYRVGGDLPLLKKLLAAGIPVLVEESFYFEEPYWPNDDLWAAHYFLVTGYDDALGTFTGQDSFYGANRSVAYDKLDQYWQAFNRVYILIYPPEKEDIVKSILGTNWDADANRQHALEIAQAETQADPKNAFAWFNVGSNLTYFERYIEASSAYDTARNLGLPQRMLRYQFGPFIAYFHSGQLDSLMALTQYALQRTPNSEEALLWHGWGLFRQGKRAEAIADFQKALSEHPDYQDAQYALNFVQGNP